ncbi:hypothetical protein B0A55_07126, partial [Friedmanniomyces simplex]
ARLDDVLIENTQLRGHTLTQRHLTGHPPAEQTARKRALTHHLRSQLPPSPTVTEEQGLAFSNCDSLANADDLLSFEAGGGNVSPKTSASPSSVLDTLVSAVHSGSSSLLDTPSPALDSGVPHTPAAPGIVDLSISDSKPNQQSNIIPPLQHPADSNGELSHTINHADGTTGIIMLTPESPLSIPCKPADPSPAIRAPTRPPWDFTFSDRTYLLGQACWIEDMDNEEYAAKWQEIAKRRNKNTAADWRGFYERVIRPDFHKQEAAKAEARDVANVAGGDMEEDAGSEAGNDLDDGATESMKTAHGKSKNEVVEGEQEPEAAKDDVGMEAAEETAAATSVHVAVDTGATSESNNSSPLTIKAQPAFEGLAASRWAPKAVASMAADIADGAPEAITDSKDRLFELPTVEEYCAAQELTAERLAAEHGDGQLVTQGAQATSTQQDYGDLRATGSDGIRRHRGPRPRYGRPGDSLGRGRYVDGRPSCCHWPIDRQQILHSNSHHDPSTLRTVMISNIPPNTTFAEVLDKVHRGKVLTATYLPLSEMRTKPAIQVNAVMVTFLYAGDARAYTEACAKIFLFFWSEKWEAPIKATVVHVQTPVRSPRTLPSVKQIRNERLSRVIYLLDNGTKTAERVISVVFSVLAQRFAGEYEYARYPVRTGRDQHGVLFFEFASVGDAVVFKQAINGLGWEFGDMGKGFLGDPCEMRKKGREEVGGVKGEDSVVEGTGGNHEGDEDGEVEPDAGQYTVEKQDASAPAPSGIGEIVLSGQPPTGVIPNSDSVPRTSWSMTGDIEAAGTLMASTTRARGHRMALRGIATAELGGEVSASGDEMTIESEAIAMEG